ncbi:Subunit of the glycosylphosphatidylinositol transamidase complex-like protein [Perkinsus olseni]|uniref:Subunit of the glycosylphosphatidylinositol transamidase complex-like protein n=1 Tax=Perkinsus olseni TaxID=32597 RepID=A0A7J6T1S5_PEROL|nr:Subunit of the glycosylphosphatidylinositol transamidase complex-like protein [Perkinsus olseni]
MHALLVALAVVLSAQALDTAREDIQLFEDFDGSGDLLVLYEMTVSSNISAGKVYAEYDILPRGIGNIVEQLSDEGRSDASFEAHLTRGVWKAKAGGPRTIFPPGAMLMAKIPEEGREEKWRKLSWALSGVLGASFEGMDPSHDSFAWIKPSVTPDGLMWKGLPYEPTCTENLTPWLALLPCSDRLGLAAVFMGGESSKIEFAESEFFSLGLLASVTTTEEAESRMDMTARLEIQLPPDSSVAQRLLRMRATGRDADFPLCPVFGAENTNIVKAPPRVEAQPVVVDRSLLRDDSSSTGEGYPDRLRMVYLLNVRNRANETAAVAVFDQLPFFLRPLWYSGGRQILNSSVAQALDMDMIAIKPTDHWKEPTLFRVEVKLGPGEEWQMRVPVLKSHIHTKSYSYACEKGFDVEAAMYEVRMTNRSYRGFTNGLLVMLPMPDFSMPFNVIALSTTVLTIFFSATYRVLARRQVREKISSAGGGGNLFTRFLQKFGRRQKSE